MFLNRNRKLFKKYRSNVVQISCSKCNLTIRSIFNIISSRESNSFSSNSKPFNVSNNNSHNKSFHIFNTNNRNQSINKFSSSSSFTRTCIFHSKNSYNIRYFQQVLTFLLYVSLKESKLQILALWSKTRL